MTGRPQAVTSRRQQEHRPGLTSLRVGQVLTRLSGVLTALAATVALAAPAAGQTPAEYRLWMAFVAQGRFGADSPWTWSADSLLRTRDFASTLEAVGQRVIIGRGLGSRASVGAGYLVGRLYPAQGDSLIEQRLVQQFAWAQPVGRTSISLRTRLEERQVEGNDGMAVRLRQQVRLVVPVSTAHGTSLSVADEIFLHVNQTSLINRGFDSHRIYGGLRQALGSRTSVDVGYYNILSRGRSGENRRSHVLSVMTAVSF